MDDLIWTWDGGTACTTWAGHEIRVTLAPASQNEWCYRVKWRTGEQSWQEVMTEPVSITEDEFGAVRTTWEMMKEALPSLIMEHTL